MTDGSGKEAGACLPVTPTTVCQLLITLDVGGAEVLAREIALRAGREFRCVFACLDAAGSLADELQHAGYGVEILQRRPGIDPHCMMRLARFCRQHRVGLIHAHLYAPFFYAAASRLCGHSTPILYTEHGRTEPFRPVRRRMLGNRLLLRSCDRVVAVGQWVREGLIANEGLPAERIEVVYNGVDLPQFATDPDTRQRLRHEWGMGGDHFLILQVARLAAVKNHVLALQSMSRLVKQVPQARLFLVGDGPERETIEQTVRAQQLQNHVRLLGRRDDVRQLLAAADAVLLTSRMEGISLALIEAMAAGVPCVATDVGGNSEVVAHGATGYLVSEHTETIAGHLARLAADRELRQQFGQAARGRAQECFDAGKMHASYQHIYHRMLRPNA